jgi:DUF4097 and DUF4098 domain-containing protein YvlB
MKKISIILVAAGVVLTASTLLILEMTSTDWWGAVQNVNHRNLEAHTMTVAPDDFAKINIKSSNDHIKIVPTDDSQVKIDYYSSDDVKFFIEVAGKELRIEQQSKLRLSFGGFISFWPSWLGAQTLTVHVPSDKIFEYSLKTSNGQVDVSNLSADQVVAINSNGDVSLSNLKIKRNAAVDTSNAKIILNSVTADELKLSTSNAKIDIKNTEVARVVAETSNANIELDKLKADDIDLDTSNASVKGSLIGRAEDYRKDMRTNFFADLIIDGVKYDEELTTNRGDKKLKVDTSNGDINLDFSE